MNKFVQHMENGVIGRNARSRVAVESKHVIVVVRLTQRIVLALLQRQTQHVCVLVQRVINEIATNIFVLCGKNGLNGKRAPKFVVSILLY
jgi:hypothetical protein